MKNVKKSFEDFDDDENFGSDKVRSQVFFFVNEENNVIYFLNHILVRGESRVSIIHCWKIEYSLDWTF